MANDVIFHLPYLKMIISKIEQWVGNCIKVYPRVEIAKIHLHFDTPENLFSLKFEWDSYNASATTKL